jgi:hypothetical protein
MAGTAIEWLNAELTEYLHIQLIWSNDKDPRNISVDPARLNGMFEQAKELEKQQIEKAHIDGGKNQRTSVQYYNETFKSE